MSRPKVQPPQFIAVTADEYELTLGAFDTVKELAACSLERSQGLRHIPKHGAWPHTTKRPGQRLQGAAVYRWTLYRRDPDTKTPAQITKPPAAGTTPTAGGFYALGYSGTASHENGNSLSASPWPFHLVW